MTQKSITLWRRHSLAGLLRCQGVVFFRELPMVIYLARCVVNGKGYVGQTVDLEQRKERHRKDAEEKKSELLFHRAIRKHGWGAFKWTVLYQDDDNDRGWMDWWERKFIRQMKTKMPNGYNMTDGGEGWLGLPRTPEHNRKIGDAHIGMKRPPETGRKISAKKKGKPNLKIRGPRGPMSEEARRNMSKSHAGKTLSEFHRQRIGAALKDREMPWVKSVEFGRKVSEGLKRKNAEMRGNATGRYSPKPPPAPAAPGQPPGTPGKAPGSPQNDAEDEEGETLPTEEQAVKTAARALERAVQSLGLEVSASGLPAIVAEMLIEKAAGR